MTSAKDKQTFFNLLTRRKLTFKELLAWAVITLPLGMLICGYIVLDQKLDRVLGRNAVKVITN